LAVSSGVGGDRGLQRSDISNWNLRTELSSVNVDWDMNKKNTFNS